MSGPGQGIHRAVWPVNSLSLCAYKIVRSVLKASVSYETYLHMDGYFQSTSWFWENPCDDTSSL